MTKKRGKRTPLTRYGIWVNVRLLEIHMTQQELAERIGVKPQNLSQMLHGQVAGHKYRPLIERILGKPPADLQEIA